MERSPVSVEVGSRRRHIEVLAVSVLGGLLLWCGARWELLGPLIGVGYVTLLAPTFVERWRAPFLGFIPGFTAFVFVINYTLGQFAWFVPLALVPLLAWHYVLLPVSAHLLHRLSGWPAVVVIPLCVGFEEWLRPLIGVGDYNMYQIGAFLHRWPVAIQAADVVGGLGLSVLWTIPLAWLVDALRWRLDRKPPLTRRKLLPGAAAAGLVTAALLGYGAWQISRAPFTEGPRIAIIQPSMDHGPTETPRVVHVQNKLTVEHVPPGSADLIAWPENAILTPYEMSQTYQDLVSWLTANRKSPLLFGTQGSGPDGRRPTASAFLVDERGELVGRYDKMVLFPFSEGRALPWLPKVAPGLQAWIDRMTTAAWGSAPNGWPGRQARALTLRTGGNAIRFWTPLCYDSCHARLAREAVRNGARFFVNLTSEGWQGWGVSNNQLAVNTLRAVENRVGVARVGNTGVSAFILPDGRVDEYLYGFVHGRKRIDRGVLIHPVMLDDRWPSLYARHGGLIDAAWPALWCAALIAALVLRARQRRRTASPTPAAA
jgi:apolipoprotein N-acyltransferase